ncbi:probable serine/threonine-protein kinase yakA [Eupeodes corollae]|uniref:probable serine/threonine-protein kinase yakA n=1 Tax=Eupeodes corollae TaxID=290404 RepID=UPI0024938B75|nr:probable serine/threonine-protein kinase yakA [Eupeodes corollae]
MRIESEQPFSNQSYQTQQSQSQQHQQQQHQQLHQQQKQQHSPGGEQSHLSFTNLPIMVNQSPNNISSTLHSSYGNLPTTGEAVLAQRRLQQQKQQLESFVSQPLRGIIAGGHDARRRVSPSMYIPTSLQQDLHSPHNSYSQSLQFDDSFFRHHQQFSTENGNGGSGSSEVARETNTDSGGNIGGDTYQSLSNQNSVNNCSSSNLGPSSNSGNARGGVGVVVGTNNNNSSSRQTGGAGTGSASCSPLHSPNSPSYKNSN